MLETASPLLDTVEPMRAKRRLSRYRRTQENKRRRQLTNALLAELGGREPSAFEGATIANIVAMQVVLDRMAAATLNGEPTDLDAQVRLSNAVARLTAALKRRSSKNDTGVGGLQAYLTSATAHRAVAADNTVVSRRTKQRGRGLRTTDRASACAGLPR